MLLCCNHIGIAFLVGEISSFSYKQKHSTKETLTLSLTEALEKLK